MTAAAISARQPCLRGRRSESMCCPSSIRDSTQAYLHTAHAPTPSAMQAVASPPQHTLRRPAVYQHWFTVFASKLLLAPFRPAWLMDKVLQTSLVWSFSAVAVALKPCLSSPASTSTL